MSWTYGWSAAPTMDLGPYLTRYWLNLTSVNRFPCSCLLNVILTFEPWAPPPGKPFQGGECRKYISYFGLRREKEFMRSFSSSSPFSGHDFPLSPIEYTFNNSSPQKTHKKKENFLISYYYWTFCLLLHIFACLAYFGSFCSIVLIFDDLYTCFLLLLAFLCLYHLFMTYWMIRSVS